MCVSLSLKIMLQPCGYGVLLRMMHECLSDTIAAPSSCPLLGYLYMHTDFMNSHLHIPKTMRIYSQTRRGANRSELISVSTHLNLISQFAKAPPTKLHHLYFEHVVCVVFAPIQFPERIAVRKCADTLMCVVRRGARNRAAADDIRTCPPRSSVKDGVFLLFNRYSASRMPHCVLNICKHTHMYATRSLLRTHF